MTVRKFGYSLICKCERGTAMRALVAQHDYFFHGTTTEYLESIKTHGINPDFEGDDSSYPDRKREPAKAMRFCTYRHPEIALETARTRAFEWDETQGTTVEKHGIVTLKISAGSLLSRSFGLDHSFSDIRDAAEMHLKDRKCLTADQFIELIERFGVISSYDTIPADELYVCEETVTESTQVVNGRYSKLSCGQRHRC